MKIYGIYDLKNNEQCVRIGTLGEIIKFLSITAREIGKVTKGSILRSRYEIVFLYAEPSKICKAVTI